LRFECILTGDDWDDRNGDDGNSDDDNGDYSSYLSLDSAGEKALVVMVEYLFL
jgi:hypothetical protein